MVYSLNKLRGRTQIKEDIKNEDDIKNENDVKNKDDLENEASLKNEDDLKNEDALSNEYDLKKQRRPQKKNPPPPTDIKPEMLSGAQTGNGIQHVAYDIRGIAHVHAYRKDDI